MSRFILFTVLATLGVPPMPGAEPDRSAKRSGILTLGDVITTAQQDNPELRVHDAEIAAARGDVTKALTWENPELGFAPGTKTTREGGSHSTAFHTNLELTQTFKFPGKRALETAIAQRNIQLQQLALEGFRFQLSARVRKTFNQMLAAQQVIGLRKEQVESAKIFVESAKKRTEGGFASDFETFKSQAELIAANKAFQRAQSEVNNARVAMNVLMARKPDAALEISGTLDPPGPGGTTGGYVALALARNPSIRAQIMEGELAGLNLDSAKLSRNPDFKIGPVLELTDREQVIGIGLTLPLPFWDKKKGEIEKATAEQRKALAEIEKERAEIVGEVTKAALELQSAHAAAALYTPEFIAKLKAFVAQAEQGYAQSATTLIIYLDAKRTYFDTLSDYYEALSKIAESRAELESAVGVPLETKQH